MSGIVTRAFRHCNLILLITGICTLASCGAPEEGLARQTEQYQVIDEGAVSGVTSTIQAPGDQVPVSAPTPEITETNLDTTTAFTILDPRVTTAPPAGFDPATSPPPGVPPASAPRATPSRATTPPVERPVSTPASTPRPTATPRPAATPVPSPAPTPIPSPTPAATPSPTQTPLEETEPSPTPAGERADPAPTFPGSQAEPDDSPASVEPEGMDHAEH